MLLVPSLRGLARHLYLACLALTAASAAVFAQSTPSAADGFDPNVNGNVYAMAKQSDGKLIIAGQFSSLQPNGGRAVVRSNIARINSDGTVDSFDPNADGPVRAIAILPNGQIIIGGDFTHVDGDPHVGLARLNSNGSPDRTFNVTLNAQKGTIGNQLVSLAGPQVFAIALETDATPKHSPTGKIIVGGAISMTKGTVTYDNLLRFNSDGTLDAAYNPYPNGTVLSLAAYTNGATIVGGGFTQFTKDGGTALGRKYIALVGSDGAPDLNFDPEANNTVAAITYQIDGKILIGGYFTTLQPKGNTSTTSRNYLARLLADGTVDADFYPSIGGSVLALSIANDGSILVGGHFTQVRGLGDTATRNYAARFFADGNLDANFNPNLNSDVDAIAIQDNDKVVFGGYFTRIQPPNAPTAVVRNHLARVLASGALDTSLQLDPGGRILASVMDSSGRLIIGGSFTSIGGATHNHIARLKSDGSVDSGYTPGFDAPVYALAYQAAADKVLVGGAFTTYRVNQEHQTFNHIARLNGDGYYDSSFNPNIDGTVGSIVVQSDGNILVGGSFANVQPVGQTTATARANLLRLTNAGQLDTTFNPTPNGMVSAIALQSATTSQPSEKILIGGRFTTLQPGASTELDGRNYFARLNKDGSVDTYNPNLNGPVSAIAIQPSDSKAIIGGQFTLLMPAGTTTPVTRNYLARINTDGSLDTTFDPEPNNIVLALGLQKDGTILVGGAFTSFTPNSGTTDTGIIAPTSSTPTTPCYAFAHLASAGTVDRAFDLGLSRTSGTVVDSINVLSADDSFYIGGTFTAVGITVASDGTATPGTARDRFAKFNKTGTLDTTVDLRPSTTLSSPVNAIALQPDGSFVVGGRFGDLGGAVSANIARFTAEGAPDTSFNAALSTDGAGVNALAIRANASVTATAMGGFGWFTKSGTQVGFTGGPKSQGQVNAMLIQPDGKIILGGAFTDTSGGSNGNLVRLKADGTVDNYATVNGSITAMALQPDGSLIVAGNFTTIAGLGDGTAIFTRNHIARLSPDWKVDGFDPNANGIVSAVVVQSTGMIVIGGSFTSLTPNGTTTAVTRGYIARLKSDGTVDTNYNPNANQYINTLVSETVGTTTYIVAGGGFTTVQPNGASSATTRNYIARFNDDGTLDTTFDPNANNVVYALAAQWDGKIVLGGLFTTLQPTVSGTASTSATTRNYLARVDTAGAVDTSFNPTVNGYVSTIALTSTPDKKTDGIVIGGSFTTATSTNGTTALARNHLALLDITGVVDSSFNPDVAGNVTGLAVASDNSILVGGTFSSLNPNGVILVGGSFSTIGGSSLTNLAELNGSGSVNGAFAPNPDRPVNAVIALPGSQGFVVGGAFTKIGGVLRNGVARFKPGTSGAADTIDSFNPSVTGTVSTLALQSDGMLLIGSSAGLIRVKQDGSTDSNFNAGSAFAPVTAIAVQPNGQILAAGTISNSTQIIRLNAKDGSVDSSFAPVSVTGSVSAIALQTDGYLIVTGGFKGIGGSNTINYLARVDSNGAVDASFNPTPNEAVTAIALQADGRMLLGGNFTTVGTLQRVGLARISNTASASQTLAVGTDGKTITWTRAGTSGVLEAVTFDTSTDGQTWTEQGVGSRISGSETWRLGNLALPPSGTPSSGTFYVRARGIAPSSNGTSTGIYQSAQVINLSSPVAGITDATVALADIGGGANQYALVYDPITGTYRTVDLRSGLVVDLNASLTASNGSVDSSGKFARLANLSTRAYVTGSTPLIGGFAIAGTAPRQVLIRAVGPSLSLFNVTNYLAQPELLVYDKNSTVIASNHGWNNDATLSAAFTRTGAFPLKTGSTDAAMLLTLNPGTYSVQVADGGNGAGGDALVELYDAGTLSDTSARLTNLSGRAGVSDQGTVIGGLVISGNTAKTLLVRGVGPALSKFTVPDILADPTIAVYDSAGNVLATNDNWNLSNGIAIPGLDVAAAVSSAAASVGAFQLDSGSKDAALIITLPAGTYTVQLSGVNAANGNGMIEVYELP